MKRQLNKMSIENKVPAIRFKGFSGEWVSKKLGDKAEFLKGQGYSKSDLSDTGNPIILYGRLYTKYETVISVVDTFVKDNGKSIVSKGNEVIVPASGETAEDIARASAVIKSGVLLGGDLNIIYPNNEIDSIFLAITISNGATQKDLSKRAQGKSVVHVRNADLKEITIHYPNKNEQTKISDYLQQIDTLIAQHQQKHDKLFNLKQSLLEKMFPKQGEKEPEIRFKGFSGEWTTSFLSDLCEETYGGGTPSTAISTYWDGDIPWIQSSDLSEEQIVEVNPRKHISERGLKNSATKLIPEESIAIVTRVGVGKISLMQKRYATSQDFLSLSKLKVSPLYGVYSIWRMLQREKITAQGTSIKGITKDELLSKIIDLPISALEQAKIGNLFKQFDSLLNKHQVQLKKLNNIKQACLEKMFV